MGIKRFAGDRFSWLSTDSKPTGVLEGSEGIELDTGDKYYYYADEWKKLQRSSPPYGQMLSTSIQPIGVISTTVGGTIIEFDTAVVPDCNTSKVSFSNIADRLSVGIGGAGTYRITYSLDILNPSARLYNITTFVKISGAEVSNSLSTRDVESATVLNTVHHISRVFFVEMDDNDYIQLFIRKGSGIGTEGIISNATLTLEYVSNEYCDGT